MEQSQVAPKVSAMFPTRFISADDLRGKEVTLTIIAWAVEEVFNLKTGAKDWATVLYFQGAKKGMLCKKRNSRTIAKLYGDDVGGWLGCAITLFPKQGQFGGEVHVKPTKPVSQPPAANGHQPPKNYQQQEEDRERELAEEIGEGADWK